MWDKFKGFLTNAFGDPSKGTSGLKAGGIIGAILTTIIGGLIGLFTGGPGGMLLGAALGLGGGTMMGGKFNEVASSIAGTGSSALPGMSLGEANTPTQELPAPVAGSKNIIEAPILENFIVPRDSTASLVEKRRELMNAKHLERLGVLKLSPDQIAMENNLEAEDKKVADFVATMKAYDERQRQYMGENGERAKLIQELVKHRMDRAKAEDAVPELPSVSATLQRLQVSPLIEEYGGTYSRDEGEDGERARGKKWEETDPISKAAYAFNRLEGQVAHFYEEVHGGPGKTEGQHGQNYKDLAPKGRERFAGLFRAAFKEEISELGEPKFADLNNNISFVYGDWTPGINRNYDERANDTLVVTTLLRKNPDTLVKDALPGEELAPEIKDLRVSEATKVWAERAKKRIIDDFGTEQDKEAIAAYDRAISYCDACNKRFLVMEELGQMNDAVLELKKFRENELVPAREKADTFINKTLPEINQQIEQGGKMASVAAAAQDAVRGATAAGVGSGTDVEPDVQLTGGTAAARPQQPRRVTPPAAVGAAPGGSPSPGTGASPS